MKIEFVNFIGQDATEDLWERVYEPAFRELRRKSPCRQYLNREEFHAECDDERIIKVLGRVEDDGPIEAMLFMSTDLETCDWIEPEYFAHHQHPRVRECYDQNKLFYVGALATNPLVQHLGLMSAILAYVENFVHVRKGMACGDFYDENAAWLPELIRDTTAQQGGVELVHFGNQGYFGWITDGFPEGVSAEEALAKVMVNV